MYECILCFVLLNKILYKNKDNIFIIIINKKNMGAKVEQFRLLLD